jgi:hypothetical protein
LLGKAVFPGMITPSGDLMILALQRKSDDQGPTETVLAAGDTLLLQGTWQALDEHLDDPDVLVVDSPGVVRRQAVPLCAGAKQAIGILVTMVGSAACQRPGAARHRGAGRCVRHGPSEATAL